jgi:hypothetical protein
LALGDHDGDDPLYPFDGERVRELSCREGEDPAASVFGMRESLVEVDLAWCKREAPTQILDPSSAIREPGCRDDPSLIPCDEAALAARETSAGPLRARVSIEVA